MPVPKPQRIRDPVHNLIEFHADPFDQMLWRVIQTEEFQRLRRIRQLGFSEFVFPAPPIRASPTASGCCRWRAG